MLRTILLTKLLQILAFLIDLLLFQIKILIALAITEKPKGMVHLLFQQCKTMGILISSCKEEW